jgi:pimeloyl-ACP methyl ester carboxylesterase
MWTVEGNTFDKPKVFPSVREEPLFVHRRIGGSVSRKLIIFVHGFGGDRYETWEKGVNESERPQSFPRFIFEKEERLSDVDIGLYAYVSGFKRLWTTSIDFSREATVMAETLRDAKSYDHIVLIGHSMGGVLIKAAVADRIQAADRATLQRICGLFLLATPQIGSLRVPRWLSGLHADMRALKDAQ